MNNYRKIIWLVRTAIFIICLPVIIPLLLLATPFCIYGWIKKKAEEIEYREDCEKRRFQEHG